MAAGLFSIDRAGQIAATICAAHCLLTPLLLAAVPLAGLELAADRRVELALVLLVVIVGAFGVVPATLRVHRRPSVLLLFLAGAALLLTAALFLQQTGVLERLVMVAGVLLVFAAHAYNLSFCRHRG